MPSDARVIGAVQRAVGSDVILVGASGGLPGELHKLWQAGGPGSYHLEYGYSCMGYEIAGGLGIKLARPNAEVVVMVGDGAYLMANSELATAVMLGAKLTIVILDNRGYGCINRLQTATGGANFNNLLKDARRAGGRRHRDGSAAVHGCRRRMVGCRRTRSERPRGSAQGARCLRGGHQAAGGCVVTG
jgi:3D-(3,5/4)-trihydroxycyclohexane-1,2-dione acylhydrolase (decyclizing)